MILPFFIDFVLICAVNHILPQVLSIEGDNSMGRPPSVLPISLCSLLDQTTFFIYQPVSQNILQLVRGDLFSYSGRKVVLPCLHILVGTW